MARTLARHKWRTAKWGAPRIRMALAQRRLPPADSAAALAELFGDEGDAGGEQAEDALLAASRSRWRLSRGLAFEARASMPWQARCASSRARLSGAAQARERRLVGWLSRRGHSWRTARDIVVALSKEDDAQDADEGDEA